MADYKEVIVIDSNNQDVIVIENNIINDIVVSETTQEVIEIGITGPQGIAGASALISGGVVTINNIDVADNGNITITIDGFTQSSSGNGDLSFTSNNDFITTGEVASISANLQTQIDNISGGGGGSTAILVGGNNIDVVESPIDTWTISVTGDFVTNSEVASISAGLDSRIVTLEGNPVPDIFKSEVAGISGNLQTQINAIIEEGTSIASSGGSLLVTQDGLAFNIEVAEAPIQSHNELLGLQGGLATERFHLSSEEYTNYIGRTEVASISGVLQGQIDNNASDIATLQSSLVSVSGDLQGQIDSITGSVTTLNSGTGIGVVESPADTWTISVTGDYITTPEVAGISGNLQTQIDNTNTDITSISGSLDNYVLKSGDIMTGTLEMSGAGIQLDNGFIPTHSEGKIFYDNVEHTLSYYNDNADVTINVGQEEVLRVRNNTGSLIENGKVVYISGSTGNRPNISLADNTSNLTSRSTIGMATHNIADNTDGYITTVGLVNGLDTSSFTEGDTIWLGENGNIITTEPQAPTHKIKIGYIIRSHPTNGRILVHVDIGKDIEQLDDVLVTNQQEGDLLSYSQSISGWKNVYNINDYTTTTQVASISAGLDARITSNDLDISNLQSSLVSVSGNLQSQITNNDLDIASISGDVDLLNQIHLDTLEPTGFLNTNEDSTLTVNEATRQVTLTPSVSGSIVYVRGVRFDLTSPLSATFSDTEGNQFFVINPSGNLEVKTIPEIIGSGCSVLEYILEQNAFVAEIYWDAVNNKAVLLDERHGCRMDNATHYWLHLNQGTQYINGLALGDITADGAGSLDSELQFSTTSGQVLDEDIVSTIATKLTNTNILVAYQSGALGTWRWVESSVPLITSGTGRAAYNNITGTPGLTEVDNTKFTLTHIFAGPILNKATGIFALIGQDQYETISEARVGASNELSNLVINGLPLPEFVPIASIIVQTSNVYSNTYKARYRTTDEGDVYISWLGTNNFTSTGSANTHNNLAGLQGGSVNEYFHLTSAQYSDYIGSSEVASISAGLDARITSNDGDITTIDARVTTLEGNPIPDIFRAEVASISGNLQTQITNNDNNITSISNNITSISGSLNDYTLLTTTSSISAGLQSQIDAIVQEGTTVASSGGTIVVTQDGLLYNVEVTDYISSTEVAGISSNLQTQIDNLSGGEGGINYITNSDAETNTTGWVTYLDAGGVNPVDGTGGTANITLTRSTSSPLRGSASFLITKDAANRQGEGISTDFTIDSADTNRKLTIEFDAKVASGTYNSSESITVHVYDITNSKLVPIGSNNEIISDGHGLVSFTTNSSTSYRLIFHVSGTGTNAWTMKLDGVKVGPQEAVMAFAGTDWEEFTPTITNVTPIAIEGHWRRVGDSMEVEIGCKVSSVGGTIELNLPNGYTIDETKLSGLLADPAATFSLIGHVQAFDSGNGYKNGDIRYNEDDNSIRIISVDVSTSSWGSTVPFTWVSSDSFYAKFKVPIVGWGGSQAVQPGHRFRFAEKFGNNMTRVTTTPTKLGEYRHRTGGTDGAPSVLPSQSDGFYAQGTLSATIRLYDIYIGKNKVIALETFLNQSRTGVIITDLFYTGTDTYYGITPSYDPSTGVLTIFFASNAGINSLGQSVTSGYFDIVVADDPVPVAQSPVVYVYATSDSGQVIVANTTILQYEDVEHDTHGAWDGTVFTAPAAGRYSVMAALFMDADGLYIILQKNGSNLAFGSRATTSTEISTLSVTATLAAGDTLRFISSESGSRATSPQGNYVNVTRVGD